MDSLSLLLIMRYPAITSKMPAINIQLFPQTEPTNISARPMMHKMTMKAFLFMTLSGSKSLYQKILNCGISRHLRLGVGIFDQESASSTRSRHPRLGIHMYDLPEFHPPSLQRSFSERLWSFWMNPVKSGQRYQDQILSLPAIL